MPSKRTNLFRSNLTRSQAVPGWNKRIGKPKPPIRQQKALASLMNPKHQEDDRTVQLKKEARDRIDDWFRNPISRCDSCGGIHDGFKCPSV